jgi:high affinity cGMP-specific 3',5'-cyclic phosphodiesterase 9
MVASVAHDIGHPGVNNTYLINSNDELALRYNDISVLENHHASSLFKILDFKSCRILDFFDEDEKKALRKVMISAILATDMAKHNSIVTNFESSIVDFNVEDESHRQAFVDMFLHSADLNN